MTVAVLFARKDSVYKTLPGCDVWDIDRDARNWPGGRPAVAHPPCRAWGRLRHFAKPRTDEKDLARFAVAQIRRWGGVLEHPQWSTLWEDQNLPIGFDTDAWGGYTLAVNQAWFGHKAPKATWLYVCGVPRAALPAFPLSLHLPTHVITRSRGWHLVPEVTKAEREHSPPEFARWLVSLAALAKPNLQARAA